MPFTLSHAGFLMPLHRRLPPYLLVAAGIGSIMPDFGYFIRRFGLAWIAHSAIGGLVVSLPIGFVVYAVCLWLWQDIAVLLPQPHRAFVLSLPRHAQNPWWVAIALLLGAYSHNILDSCTHKTGWVVMHVTLLREPLFIVAGDAIAPYRLLQQLGSMVGMVLLLWIYGRALRQFCTVSGLELWTDRDRWLLVVGLFAMTGIVSGIFSLHILFEYTSMLGLRMFVFQVLITWMPLMFGAIAGLALVRRVQRT